MSLISRGILSNTGLLFQWHWPLCCHLYKLSLGTKQIVFYHPFQIQIVMWLILTIKLWAEVLKHSIYSVRSSFSYQGKHILGRASINLDPSNKQRYLLGHVGNVEWARDNIALTSHWEFTFLLKHNLDYPDCNHDFGGFCQNIPGCIHIKCILGTRVSNCTTRIQFSWTSQQDNSGSISKRKEWTWFSFWASRVTYI